VKVTSLEAGRDWNWRRAKGGGGGVLERIGMYGSVMAKGERRRRE